MTQKLKRIQNRNSKQHAHFTTLCIREQQQQKLELLRIQWYFFVSFTYCRYEETRSWENRQLLSSDTNSGLSWVTLTSHDPIKWYLRNWESESESEVAQSCPTLCNPMDCKAYQAPPSMEFSRQEYWSGLPFPENLSEPIFCLQWKYVINVATFKIHSQPWQNKRWLEPQIILVLT